jgi:hypothetical protein
MTLGINRMNAGLIRLIVLLEVLIILAIIWSAGL